MTDIDTLPEREATPDEAFELGRVRGYDEAMLDMSPRVVSTVAELDALPRDSIIHVPGGSASARKSGDGLWSCDYAFHQGRVPSSTFLNPDGNLIGVVVLWVGGTE